jgi:hypothetical protein
MSSDEHCLSQVLRVRVPGAIASQSLETMLGEGSLFLPGGVAVDRHGNLCLANWSVLPATGSPDAPPGARAGRAAAHALT